MPAQVADQSQPVRPQTPVPSRAAPAMLVTLVLVLAAVAAVVMLHPGLRDVRLLGSRLAHSSSQPDAAHYYGHDPRALALAKAVAAGDRPQIAQLVADGADPDAVGADNITMAQWAIESGSPDGLAALLDAGALRDRLGRAGRAPLHEAARQRDPRYVQILLAAGADPEVRVAYTRTTALREACLAGHDATFDALLDGGADLEATDEGGDRALHICARADNGALVLRLLQHGADPTARNAAGNTFQDYYFSFSDSLISQTASHEHRQVARWLESHQIRLVPRAEPYR